jgi:hypothetical protein
MLAGAALALKKNYSGSVSNHRLDVVQSMFRLEAS